jgi:hypothetical protein
VGVHQEPRQAPREVARERPEVLVPGAVDQDQDAPARYVERRRDDPDPLGLGARKWSVSSGWG